MPDAQQISRSPTVIFHASDGSVRQPKAKRHPPRQKRTSRVHLTRRDQSILKALFTARYLSTPQIQQLFWQRSRSGTWGPQKACQRRLRQLASQRLVRRIEIPVKRGQGARPYVYTLDKIGAQLLATELGVDARKIAWRRQPAEENYPFLEHTLATNDFRIAIGAAAQLQGTVVEKWLDERELKSAAMKDTVTLAHPITGRSIKVAVVPDAYFCLRVANRRRGHFFVEIDRRTVTVEPSIWERRGWSRKVRAYMAYQKSGQYRIRYAASSFRVLCVTTGERRLAHLQRVTEKAGGSGQFYITTFAEMNAEQILTGRIWRVAGAATPVSLLD